MNRVWGMLRWVREKMNIKLALVVLVMGTGLSMGYIGYRRISGKQALPEPKKVVTGGGAPIPGDPAEFATPAAAEAPVYDPHAPVGAPTQPPPFAFNSNAYGTPATTPPADSTPPAYSADTGAPAQLAPYQPVVAGDNAAYAADPAQPPAEEAPLPSAPPDGQPAPFNSFAAAPGDPPANPIRGSASLSDDPATEPTPTEAMQPNAYAPPGYDSAPTEPIPTAYNPMPLRSAPLSLAPETASPNSYAPQVAATDLAEPAPRALGGYSSSAAASPRDAGARSEATGQGTPGERHFEGAQTPALTLEKVAPAEIQVGKLATFELHVKNVGQIPAQQVQVTDQIPRGTQLVEAKPQFQRAADGTLVWPLGTMQPGDEKVIQLQVMPQAEGEIGSVAQVTFAATATARSISTRPLLTIEHSAPEKLLIGETLNMTITVSNPGTGAATGVVVEEDVPQGLSHQSGNELEYEIGTLRPGESKRMELTLRADKAGIIKNTIVVRGDANLAAQHEINIEVIAPQLQVGVVGPKKRFLERPATYTVSVSNPGTAAARDVELVAYLPRGMKFVETDSQGTYDPQQHAVFWSLQELPATKAGNVKLTAMPQEVGDQKLRIEGRADLGLNTAFEQVVSVDAAAELIHTIADLSDPIEVGSDTTYEVKVTNIGTKSATNIRISAMLPPELKALSGEGPTRAANDGSRVIFEPLARLNPQEEAVFRIQANAQKAGDFIIRVQISSNEWPNPVTREESTRVYLDR
ncbi:Large cysteine-rich periplasmic protein OmcB precursor [Anatilimnocola aggregata]|uniref:Large cysteine-rich periplasmic protein OmcB n=1 Tax=Anatilimnocola aggregata TaxID=2528021 RepID=A0A517Y5L4_9BACT|nr:DUF11 domain-containing protein [Anatilimnocola aggregata]QDU25490.1 Large cysteine-rich periplasmic protein OmcB precursor [Anatilimnocola aggregata]